MTWEQVRLRRVPNLDNQLELGRHCIHLLDRTHFETQASLETRTSKPSSVCHKTDGAFQFAYELPVHLCNATPPIFATFWAERPNRKLDPRYPTISPETHQILQVHARN